MTKSDNVIDIQGLVKNFGSTQALNGLDLQVTRGEVHGFLGPNGAGKSTTIRILLGLLKADSGLITLLGGDPWRDVVPLHRRLAYVSGDVSLWPTMSGGEAIDLLGALRGGLNAQRRAELLERFDLDPTKRGRQYSKGNRQKVALIAALASDAELLILDEPTSGLDPLMEMVFQEVLLEAKERGVTVLLSSHILSEAEALADRLSIIRNGTVVETGTMMHLRGRSRSTLTAVLESPPSPSLLSLLPDARVDGCHLHAPVETDMLTPLLAALSSHGVRSLSVAPPTLESLFARHYSDTAEVESTIA